MAAKPPSASKDSSANRGPAATLLRSVSFDTLLTSFSSTFIQLPPEDVDTEIEHWLARIIEFLDFDRSAVIQRQGSDNTPRVTHTCSRPGIKPLEIAATDKVFPWLTSELKKGHIITFSSLDELPPEAGLDKANISKFGTRSMAAVPFIAAGENFGALVFSTIGREREWPPAVLQQLHLTGQVFASALLRKRNALALLESERRFAAAAKSASDIIYEYDIESDRHDLIGDIDGLLGYAPGEFPRNLEGWKGAVHPDDVAKFMKTVARFLETGDDYVISYRMRRKDGTYLHWEDRGTAVAWEDGAPTRLVGACTDVTERLKLETDARQLRNRLSRVSRVSTIGELTANLAHEINQPLAAIRSNAHAALRLLDADEPDLREVRAALADIVSDNQRAGNVIRNIRTFLKGTPVDTSLLSINELLEEVLDLIRGELRAHHIRVRRHLGRHLPPVAADRIQIQQVVLNLFINAMEAMSDQPENIPRDLEIHTSRADGSIGVSIRDTGKGLDPNLSESIFDPLVTTKNDGMGLGLSICKSIIERHGGRLSARKRVKRGSAFHFTLPLPAKKKAGPKEARR